MYLSVTVCRRHSTRIARPVLYEGGWHAARFEVGNTEPAKAVETLLAVSNEIAEHVRNGWMQVNLTESTCRLRSLDSTLLYGLYNRNRVGAEVLHFETKQFHIDLHFTNSQSRGDGSGDWNPRFFRRTAGLGCIARFGWAQLVRRC